MLYTGKEALMAAEQVNVEIGRKIKNLRNRNGLTQQELADRTELTKGFISQLERGQVSPSVVTLMDLIECLGTTPGEFFKESTQEQIVFTGADCFEKVDEQGNCRKWLVPTAQKFEMEPLLVTLAPHQTLEEDKPHTGEEFGYVLAGNIILVIGSEKLKLKKGDSFCFKPNESHYIVNPSKREAKLIWVATPPSF